jgi:pyruvate,water dikinase
MEPANPVHMTSGSARWTTVNFSEALPGVQTPLSWGVWNYGMEIAIRRAYGELGVLSRAEVPVPSRIDDRVSGIFYGRAAGNVGFFRLIGDRLPGSSGDVIEEKLFGSLAGTPTRPPRSVMLRYPVILAKMPRALWRHTRELPGMLEQYRAWWREATIDRPPQDLAATQRLIRDSADRFAAIGVHHTIVTILGPQLLQGLADLAEAATGDRALGAELATGFGGMEETAIIEDVWSAAQGRLSVSEIQRRHGFHGPNEGRLDTHSWREDPTPIEAVMRSYAKGDVADPRARERAQIARREEAQRRVLAGLPAMKRGGAKLTMKLASIFLPAREVGKASFLHTLDGARCAARAGGSILADQGFIAHPEDVFFLTFEEFTGPPDRAFAELVAERRENDARYQAQTLPPMWTGDPQPVPIVVAEAQDVSRLEGIGIVGGTVTGRARVIGDPATAELEPGDILVCATTDPSWTPLFMLAGALVIDTGGEVSHGAIVARELGVTCVINTVSGTRDIPDGAMLTVDGTTGRVEIARPVATA